MPNQTVTSIDEFKAKYGQHGLAFRLTLEEFIQRAPEFKGGFALAKLLGEQMADLESALKDK